MTHDMEDLVEINAPVQWEFFGGPVSDFHQQVLAEIIGEEKLAEAAAVTQKIIEKARDEKGPPPPMDVVPAGTPEQPPVDDFLADVVFVGADYVPLTANLYRNFRGDPKYVRLDTPESYQAFRHASSPEMAELQNMVQVLAELVRAHLSDGHGGQAREYAHEIERLKSAEESKRIPLSLPPWAEGTWDCWREGDVICCSIGLPGNDGRMRICTSATPVAKHVDEVVGYTHAVGGDVPSLIGVLPTIACMMGGGSLIPTMCAAAPAILSRPEVVEGGCFIGRLVPKNKPSSATLYALLQRAQAGDPDAVKEWQQLGELAKKRHGLAERMERARHHLVKAQRSK